MLVVVHRIEERDAVEYLHPKPLLPGIDRLRPVDGRTEFFFRPDDKPVLVPATLSLRRSALTTSARSSRSEVLA